MKKLAFILALAPLIWGCSKKSVTVVQSKTMFSEILPYSAEVVILTDPSLDPRKVSAEVLYENIQVTLSEMTARPGKVEIKDNLPYPGPQGRCSLEVSTPLGPGRGAVYIPQHVYITRPSSRDTLPWGDVQITWRSTPNARWYETGISFSMYDSSGEWLGYVDTGFAVSDTMLVLPEGFIRRDPLVTYVTAYADLYPHDGPRPGEAGNLAGDFHGVLLSTGYSDFTTFQVGLPPPGIRSNPPHGISEMTRRKYLRQWYGM